MRHVQRVREEVEAGVGVRQLGYGARCYYAGVRRGGGGGVYFVFLFKY